MAPLATGALGIRNAVAKSRISSRPSDAIALALRADCPIYVDMEVIKASRNTLPTEESEEGELSSSEEEWPDVIGEAGDLPM